MTTPVLLPKLGNSVETCIIETWHKEIGDTVAVGEILCAVETDKATLDVESPAAGILITRHANEGDEVAVLTTIATLSSNSSEESSTEPSKESNAETQPSSAISPRAKKLATQQQIDLTKINGSGPNGRIIERDIYQQSRSSSRNSNTIQPEMTPVAKRMVKSGEFGMPTAGSGPKGRVMRRDLETRDLETRDLEIAELREATESGAPDEFEIIPIKGVRRVIAQRMRAATEQSAPVTLHRYTDARALQHYRQRLKQSDPQLGLTHITLNDLLHFAVVQTLIEHKNLNAHFLGSEIRQFNAIHLGFAVDTVRGLLVPVIRDAHKLGLKALAAETKRLADACTNGNIKPDELSNATFTISNLGGMGIETFTPILNLPQVGILGVGAISLRPLNAHAASTNEPSIDFVPHIALSLTVDHQGVDGAPAARFLQTLTTHLANIDLLSISSE